MDAVEVTGDRTGRHWRGHITADRLEAPGGGKRWRVTDVDDGSVAYYHHYRREEMYADDIARLRTAIEIASLPQIAASEVIVRLIDVQETPDTTGAWAYPGVLGVVWELADLALDEFLTNPNDDRQRVATEIETNVGQALDQLHALGWIHLDVAPNNVLRVDGIWKLADLDSCTRRGDPVTRNPGKTRYIHPKRRPGNEVAYAIEDYDQWGLQEILRALREK